jgi:hypothetical protein
MDLPRLDPDEYGNRHLQSLVQNFFRTTCSLSVRS